MKRKHLVLFFLLQGLLSFALAQNEPAQEAPKKRPYIATVLTTDHKKVKGLLYRMNDDSIVVITSKVKFSDLIRKDPGQPVPDEIAISSERISTVKIKRKNSGGRGALFGFGIGATAGVLGGFISGDDPIAPYTGDFLNDLGAAIQNGFAATAEEKALAGGIGLGLAGAGTGAIIGALVKRKFNIQGSREKMHEACLELAAKIPFH